MLLHSCTQPPLYSRSHSSMSRKWNRNQGWQMFAISALQGHCPSNTTAKHFFWKKVNMNKKILRINYWNCILCVQCLYIIIKKWGFPDYREVQSLFNWSERELLPSQCFPSPLNPVLQVHLYEVGVFWQIASMWQASLPSAHWSVYHKNTTRDFTVNTADFSLQSTNELQNFTILNKLHFCCDCSN